uniref:Vessel-specific 1 n=1 Tax=Nothobranchius kadleci TaxID=1051664 RepID=A0A1A8CWP7_NOTKA
MYSSSYSQAKLGPLSREQLHKPKGKSCGYYMRIIFFFSSLIQSLIIVSLVLFLIYGQPEKSAEEKRIKELEMGFNMLSDNNVKLKKEKGELGVQLSARTAEKAAVEREMMKLKMNFTSVDQDLRRKLANSERAYASAMAMARRPSPPIQPPPFVSSNNELKVLESLNAQQKTMIDLLHSNFTQTVQYLSQERDSALRDRDTHLTETINLRTDNRNLKDQLTAYTRKCKEDFATSLNGIQTVTKAFLEQINNLFPHQLTFHLTCNSQKEQLEKIKSSCTNLSRDVENKFQLYLNSVGNKVAEIQAQSSKMEVQIKYLNSSLQRCEQKHSELIARAAKDLELKQKAHDDQVEKLLVEQNRLRDQKKLQDERLALKEKELQTLQGILPNNKAGPAGSLQSAQQQSRQAPATWSLSGTHSSSRAPTVG